MRMRVGTECEYNNRTADEISRKPSFVVSSDMPKMFTPRLQFINDSITVVN